MSLTLSVEDNVHACEYLWVEQTFGALEHMRILGIKNVRRRAESLAGLAALKKTLGKRISENTDIQRNSCGRPSFVGREDLDFSISHSGNLSVAVLIDSPYGRVGVDIERIDEEKKDAHRRISQRYFSQEERDLVEASKTAEAFYKIWTTKEAKAKLTGKGLAELLSENKSLTEEDGKYIFSYFLLTYNGEKYMLTVCATCGDEVEVVCNDGICVFPLTV